MNKWVVRVGLIVVLLLVLYIVVGFYLPNLKVFSVEKNVFNDDALKQLDNGEISSINFSTVNGIDKNLLIEELESKGHILIEQLGAVRVFEYGNSKYMLSEKIAYKYFIKWEYIKM